MTNPGKGVIVYKHGDIIGGFARAVNIEIEKIIDIPRKFPINNIRVIYYRNGEPTTIVKEIDTTNFGIFALRNSSSPVRMSGPLTYGRRKFVRKLALGVIGSAMIPAVQSSNRIHLSKEEEIQRHTSQHPCAHYTAHDCHRCGHRRGSSDAGGESGGSGDLLDRTFR